MVAYWDWSSCFNGATSESTWKLPGGETVIVVVTVVFQWGHV